MTPGWHCSGGRNGPLPSGQASLVPPGKTTWLSTLGWDVRKAEGSPYPHVSLAFPPRHADPDQGAEERTRAAGAAPGLQELPAHPGHTKHTISP